MTALRIGSLFSGYGGLDMAVTAVLGGSTAWVSDIDNGACKILAHRYPDAPNIGDITQVDWADVEPVDVLCGGFPCQDVSAAGKRAGIRPGTRSGLWSQFAYAISQLRPSLVVIENVRGLLSASAHSDLEPCPWCVGEGPGVHLRALGAVLGDLADLGYDAAWHGVRAADVGAPHGRFRVFITAWPANSASLLRGVEYGDCATASDARGEHGQQRRVAGPGEASGRRTLGQLAGRGGALLPTPVTRDVKGRNQRDDTTCLTGALLPTPRAGDGDKGGPNQRGSSGDLMLPSAVTLLPTPAVNDMGAAYTPETWDAWTASMQAKHGNGNGHGKSLEIESQRLQPAPGAGIPGPSGWGVYAGAIGRWEQVTRVAPCPTEPRKKGTPRLSPRFSEWMMGVPYGWITDVPGITRNEALKACGNGVVPQQAEAALRWLLPLMAEAVAF